jgi:hypothetical protein
MPARWKACFGRIGGGADFIIAGERAREAFGGALRRHFEARRHGAAGDCHPAFGRTGFDLCI